MDGLILVIVLIVINRCKGCVRSWLALVEVVYEQPEICHEGLQMSALAGAELLGP